MRTATWYFDFISPFAYICLHRLKELPADLRIEFRPVLFAAMLVTVSNFIVDLAYTWLDPRVRRG